MRTKGSGDSASTRQSGEPVDSFVTLRAVTAGDIRFAEASFRLADTENVTAG